MSVLHITQLQEAIHESDSTHDCTSHDRQTRIALWADMHTLARVYCVYPHAGVGLQTVIHAHMLLYPPQEGQDQNTGWVRDNMSCSVSHDRTS